MALADYAALNPRVVVLDADVSSSDFTSFFAKKHPERFFNFGVTEASMVDVGVGMALAGSIPFVNTFASLLTLRAFESIRTCVAYAHTNVKLIGGYSGLSDYKDGPTHFALNDISLLRSLPGMVVLSPADNIEAARLVPVIAEYDGPVYMRISRAAIADVFTDAHQPVIGRGALVRPGRDVTIIATGCMVGRSLEAVKLLAQQGVDARLVSMHSIKPLDKELVIQAAVETGAIVTAEDHTVIGGLGSAVAEALAQNRPVPLEMVGVCDAFAETGPDPDTLMDAWGLSIADVVSAVQQVLRRKNQ
jgi:transketolase